MVYRIGNSRRVVDRLDKDSTSIQYTIHFYSSAIHRIFKAFHYSSRNSCLISIVVLVIIRLLFTQLFDAAFDEDIDRLIIHSPNTIIYREDSTEPPFYTIPSRVNVFNII